jgi:acyl dehydratase
VSALPVVGTPIETMARGPITLEMLKLYAQASGDYNPIHTNEAAAKEAGLPGIIAHGMLSAGFLADRAVRFMKPWEKNWKCSGIQARFKAMTFLGDTISISGAVKSITPDMIRLELNAKNGKGELTTQAFVEFTAR